MDHQSFRFYIPGIVFLIPIYLVVCWITVNYYTDSDFRTFILLGGITTFPVIALPIGWWIYNAYRVWWLILTRGGYENKEFVKLIRKDTKPFYSPLTHSILIDFSHLKDIKSWINIDPDIFRKTFYPFTSYKNFLKEIKQKGIHPKFTEPLSDYILFKDDGYDYARSISSVRYGLESSVFALMLSILYAFGIKYIWLFNLNKTTNEAAFTFWIAILSLLSLIVILTLFMRWRYADREYDARLILTTLTSLKSNYFDTKVFEEKIPKEIVKKIDLINLSSNSYAAFDLDNTLIVDDIGEAVFAALVKEKLIEKFNWKDYISLLEQNREVAYKKVIDVMSGLEINKLVNITHEILESGETHINIDADNIPIPTPNSIMQSLISLLRTKGIDIFIVTASNKISAEIICWKYFGIPSSHILGAKVVTDKRKKIISNSSQIPYAQGKVSALKSIFSDKPIITAGDGSWDKYLLDYTTPDGIRLWLGQDKKEYQKLKNSFYKDLDFYHIPRE